MSSPEALTTPQHQLTAAERRALLEQHVANYVSAGWRVEVQGDAQAVLVTGRRPNHLLHFFIGIFTIGLWWLFVWLPLAIFGGERRRALSVDPYGHVVERKGRG